MLNRDVARSIRKASRITFWSSVGLLVLTFVALSFSAAKPIIVFAEILATIVPLTGILYLGALKIGQAEIKQEVAPGIAQSGRPVILFLRSFDLARSGLIRRVLQVIKLIAAVGLEDSTFFGTARYDVEEELDTAIGAHGTFVAIGNKQASYGSTKIIVSDADWQEIFRQLTDMASIIFMMPGPSPAVLWELSQIVGSPSLAKKTVFIMPREGSMLILNRGIKSLTRRGADWSVWNETAEFAARELGVTLPPYNSEGCYFRLGNDGRPAQAVSLELFTTRLQRCLAGQASSRVSGLDQLWERT